MPATVRTDHDSDEQVEHSPSEHGAVSVTDHLDLALVAARDQGMTASELMGVLFYYAHNVAESYRQDVLRDMEDQA